MVIDQMVAEDLVAAARGLREADLQRFRDELEQQRQFRLDQLVELTDDARVAGDDAPGDALGEVNAVLTSGARTALAEIDAALVRLAIGTFGTCQRCGRALSSDHLHAFPTATVCVHCHVARRPLKPDVHLRRIGTIPRASSPVARKDIVEIWGEDSFPASDPPANW